MPRKNHNYTGNKTDVLPETYFKAVITRENMDAMLDLYEENRIKCISIYGDFGQWIIHLSSDNCEYFWEEVREIRKKKGM